MSFTIGHSQKAQETSVNVSLATRLALLELLTVGAVPDPASALAQAPSQTGRGTDSASPSSPNASLVARSGEAHARLQGSVGRYKPIVQFVEQYRANQAYLLPQLNTAAATANVSQDTVAPQSIIALLLDAEADVKQLERDLRSCDNYAKRDVAGAGRLADHEPLRVRLDAVKTGVAQKLAREQETERRAMVMMERYAEQVGFVLPIVPLACS